MYELMMMEFFKTVPWLTGYHAIPMCLRPFERLETAVVLGSLSLNSSLNAELIENENNQTYTGHCYFLVQRMLRYIPKDGGYRTDLV
jgi:hypothetical protein